MSPSAARVERRARPSRTSVYRHDRESLSLRMSDERPAVREVRLTRPLLKADGADVAGKEAVVLSVEGAPEVVVPNHFHPGEEFIYEGAVYLEVEGKPPVTVKAGEVYHIPVKAVHSGKNPSATAPFKILTFGIFAKGQPDTTRVP